VNVVNDSIRRRIAVRRGGGKVIALAGDERDERGQPEVVEQKLMLEKIDKILARDEENQQGRNRRIFWLYYRQGFTSKAIASLPGMQLSAKGIEAVLQRLTKLVRRELWAPVSQEREGFREASAFSKEDAK
jgi:RNA polymerase sigma-70 factor (ECF subfamily)